ncbi:MAG: tyrosine-protein phosphatase [Anaerolineae bacterium]|nr:tyrosine-protein phosphatase [Anaerolineae bacterium]
MPITKLPFNLPGKVFRSPMPFGFYDHGKSTLQAYLDEQIDYVVMLTSDAEASQLTGIDLRALYAQQGFEVIHFPIVDFSVPGDKDAMSAVVDTAIQHARDGKNLVVHCYAGLGRAGMFAALMARRILNIGGKEAIDWVRQHIPGAVQTFEQTRLVIEDLG